MFNEIAIKTIKFNSIIGLYFMLMPLIYSQTPSENQFQNQFQFNKNIGKKSSLEFNFSQKLRSGTEETNPFYKNSQESLTLWFHYFLNKKWKISGMGGFFYNHRVPEINQNKVPEVRFSFQGTYYIRHSNKFVFTSRTRIEDRILGNPDENSVEIVYRLRERLKIVYPLTQIKLGEGALYVLASEELYIKTAGDLIGKSAIDRNQLSAGLGYTFTDNFHIELNYINEYLVKTDENQINHIISTKLVLTDLVTTLKRKLGVIPSY